MDTDSSSFALVCIYKELEGALSTVVQLYSEAPAARPPCSAPLLTAHLALSPPRAPPHLSCLPRPHPQDMPPLIDHPQLQAEKDRAGAAGPRSSSEG